MLESRLGRTIVVYASILGIMLLLLIATENLPAEQRQRMDWLLIAVGFGLYMLVRLIVLPRWNAREDRTMGVSKMAAQSSHDTLRTVLAMLTLVVACMYWFAEIYLGTKFSDEVLRSSALELTPALGSLFVSIAVLIAPLRFAWQPRLSAVFFLVQVLVLIVFAVGAVFVVPAIALQEWQTTYTNEEYAKSLHPQWLALPIAAAAYRIIRRRSNAAKTNNAI